MRAYVDALIRKDEEHGGERLLRFGFCLGDWLSQDGVNSSAFRGATNEHFIASCYYFNSVKLLAKAERALGDEERAERYFGIAEEIRRAILREYFTATGRLAVDTQTAYVLCIMFGIWVEREKLVSSFEKRIKKDGFAIKGGFVGATKLIQALVRAGLTEDAFRILYSEKFPSWLYCVNLGATTIWERWNSLAGTLEFACRRRFHHGNGDEFSQPLFLRGGRRGVLSRYCRYHPQGRCLQEGHDLAEIQPSS